MYTAFASQRTADYNVSVQNILQTTILLVVGRASRPKGGGLPLTLSHTAFASQRTADYNVSVQNILQTTILLVVGRASRPKGGGLPLTLSHTAFASQRTAAYNGLGTMSYNGFSFRRLHPAGFCQVRAVPENRKDCSDRRPASEFSPPPVPQHSKYRAVHL